MANNAFFTYFYARVNQESDKDMNAAGMKMLQ